MGIQNNRKICGSARVSAYLSHIVLRIKYNQTCFALVLMHLFHKTVDTIVCKVSRGEGFIQLISQPSCLSTGLFVTGIPFYCRYGIFKG